MTTKVNFSSLVKAANASLEFATRANGAQFVRFKEDAPQDIVTAIRAAHEGMQAVNNDWLWGKTWDLLAYWEQNEGAYLRNLKNQWCILEVDPMLHTRYMWLHDFPCAAEISDDATAQKGLKCTASIDDRLGYGQEVTLHRLWQLVNSELFNIIIAHEAAQ